MSGPFSSTFGFGQIGSGGSNPFALQPSGGPSQFGSSSGTFGGTCTGAFGQPARPNSGDFGSPNPSAKPETPAFGGPNLFAQQPSGSPSHFGSSSWTSSGTRTGVFGQPTQPISGDFRSPNPFGGSNSFAQLPSGSPSQFGSSAGTFGGTCTGAFGQPTQPVSGDFRSPNPFAQSATAAFGVSSPFTQQPSGSSSHFGSSSWASSGTRTGVFGQPTQPIYGDFRSPNPFGGSNSFVQQPSGSPSQFGSSAGTFGGVGTGAFGQPTQPVSGDFRSPNPFTQPETAALGVSSPFAQQPSGSPSHFGSSSGTFDGTRTGVFGQPTQPISGAFWITNPFAKPATPALGGGSSSSSLFRGSSQFGQNAGPGNLGSTSNGITSSNPFGFANPLVASSQHAFSIPAFGTTSSQVSGVTNTTFRPFTPIGPSTPSFSRHLCPSDGMQVGTTSLGFGTQSSSSGTQVAASRFSNSDFGPTSYVGNRVAKHTPTQFNENDKVWMLQSMSAMPVYQDKSHEELRWKDFCHGDKGGQQVVSSTHPGIFELCTPNPTSVSTTSVEVSNTSAAGPNFAPFKGFTPSISAFSTTTVDPKPSWLSFTTPAVISPNTPATVDPKPSWLSFTTPAVISPNAPATVDSKPSWFSFTSPAVISPNTPDSKPSLGSLSTPAVTSNTSATVESSLPGGFTAPAVSYSTPANDSTLCSGFMSSTVNSSNAPASLDLSGGFSLSSFSVKPAVVTPIKPDTPNGRLSLQPQLFPARENPKHAVQYGISSMPVAEKPMPTRIFPLSAPRHLTSRKISLPLRKYNARIDGPKVPFFENVEKVPTLPKVDLGFMPRENPRSLWPGEAGSERKPILKDDHQSPSRSDKAGETVAVNEQSAGVEALVPKLREALDDALHEALLPKLRSADYFTEPRIQELAAKERARPGFCSHIKDFVVGRHGYGSIKFYGETDVRGLDVESIVEFNNREIIVYKEEGSKPSVGQGLNKPAEVTLLNVKCIDMKTGEFCTEGPKVEKYRLLLVKKSEDQGAEFVTFDAARGVWTFRVKHF